MKHTNIIQGVRTTMSTTEPLCRLIGIDPKTLSKEESMLLEAELFYNICEELTDHFKKQHKDYFRLMKLTKEMENVMLEENFIRLVMKDILSTNEYTLDGIANYTDTHEDVVREVILGRNSNPSAMLLRKTIELHRLVRSELYGEFMKKIAEKYLTAA